MYATPTATVHCKSDKFKSNSAFLKEHQMSLNSRHIGIFSRFYLLMVQQKQSITFETFAREKQNNLHHFQKELYINSYCCTRLPPLEIFNLIHEEIQIGHANQLLYNRTIHHSKN
jgi:hypothetical protein